MKLLTGNDLKTGAVIWWDGRGWSVHIADAVDTGEQAEEIARREEAARRVNVPYIVDAEMDDQLPRPTHIKERIRALGPTVRTDLTQTPANPQTNDWVS